MAVPARIRDLVDALEMQNDEAAAFLNRETGEVHVLSHEALRIAEDETDVSDVRHDCEKEEIELAQLIFDSDRYLALPPSYAVHEWRAMPRIRLQSERPLAHVGRAPDQRDAPPVLDRTRLRRAD